MNIKASPWALPTQALYSSHLTSFDLLGNVNKLNKTA